MTRAWDEGKTIAGNRAQGLRNVAGTAAILGTGYGTFRLTEYAQETGFGQDVRNAAEDRGVNYIEQASEAVCGKIGIPERGQEVADGTSAFLGAALMTTAARRAIARIIERRAA